MEKSLSEKEILSCLGKVLSNARDWYGGRKKVKNISTSSSASFTSDSQQVNENQAKTLTDSLQQDATTFSKK